MLRPPSMGPIMPWTLDFMASSARRTGFVDGGGDEIFEQFDIGRGAAHDGGVDLELEEFLLAVHAGGDDAAAGGGFDDSF